MHITFTADLQSEPNRMNHATNILKTTKSIEKFKRKVKVREKKSTVKNNYSGKHAVRDSA